jgi:hypothetical protein
MSKVGVKLKIDVSKIDKSLLYKGAKGIYLDATVFVDLDTEDKYGNSGMITQDESKQNRDAGHNGPILGNCKIFWKDGGQQMQGRNNAPSRQQQHSNHGRKPAPQPAPAYDDFDDSTIPF